MNLNIKRLLVIGLLLIGSLIGVLLLNLNKQKAEQERLRYTIEGELTLDKVAEFEKQLKAHPDINELELRSSRGSGSSAGIIINRMYALIDARQMRTFARGQCASACAFVFLYGYERTLLPPQNTNISTHLMVHAGRSNTTGEINYGETDRDFNKIIARSNGKLNMALLEKVYDAKNKEGGLFFVRDGAATKAGKEYVFFCTGEEQKNKKTCEPYKGIKLEDLGIKIAQ